MEEATVAVNIVADAPNGNVYYELDVEGDGDSSTTPCHPSELREGKSRDRVHVLLSRLNANPRIGLILARTRLVPRRSISLIVIIVTAAATMPTTTATTATTSNSNNSKADALT
jgi:hypothetical protein